VPVALAGLGDGGTLAVAGIYLTDIPPMDYEGHLFHERTLTSVTANTRQDGEEWLRLAAAVGVRPEVAVYSFDDVPRAIDDIRAGRISGAAVVRVE
jgi:propanol-preferring alcohol dehydrogenase